MKRRYIFAAVAFTFTVMNTTAQRLEDTKLIENKVEKKC